MVVAGGDSDSCRASQEALDGTSVHIQDIQFSCERVGKRTKPCVIFVCVTLRLTVLVKSLL